MIWPIFNRISNNPKIYGTENKAYKSPKIVHFFVVLNFLFLEARNPIWNRQFFTYSTSFSHIWKISKIIRIISVLNINLILYIIKQPFYFRQLSADESDPRYFDNGASRIPQRGNLHRLFDRYDSFSWAGRNSDSFWEWIFLHFQFSKKYEQSDKWVWPGCWRFWK